MMILGMVRSRQRNTVAGFSLIELAIVMVIAGLFVAASAQTYRLYTQRIALNSTIEKKNNIEQSLSRFLSINGRLPCPADPAIATGTANAGVENCRPNGAAWPALTCSASGALCRIEGRRRLVPQPIVGLPVGENDRVLKGGVPYVTLGISESEAYDAWGSMFTYGVTELMSSSFIVTTTTPPPANLVNYDEIYGTVNIRTWDPVGGTYIDNRNPRVLSGGIGVIGSWMLALVSHGPDKKGGWTRYGSRPIACAGQGQDVQNCDPQSSSFQNRSRVALVPGPDFYDDAVLSSSVTRESDKWYFSTASAIRNKSNRIGIGTESPNESLEVVGNMRILDARANQYCDANGANCFSSNTIGGVGIRCSGGAMRAIANNLPECVNEVATDLVATGSCPGGQYLVGFCANGTRMCKVPGTPNPVCP